MRGGQDTDTTTTYAYKPKVFNDSKAGVYGRAELYSQYYDGSSITINCYTSAYNPTNKSYRAYSKFKHTVRNRFGDLVRDPPDERTTPSKTLEKNGGAYNESDSLSEPVGRIARDETYNSDAYIRLTVSGIVDTWFIGNNEDFTKDDDNP